jgi:lipid-A-disaccharide synthase
VVDAASLAVVGLAEVIWHIPRIWFEFKKLCAAAREVRPDLAILTDSPDFHLRLARKLRRQGVPVAYLVAPQVWAWRRGRLGAMRRDLRHLLCIFPFEEAFFRREGLPATYIGHPLAGFVRPQLGREEFFRKHGLSLSRQLITVMPGSRRGESARHLPYLLDAVERLGRAGAVQFLLPASPTTGAAFYRERIGGAPIQVIDGENWDAMAHATVVLAASGTVTIEAALLGAPMVTYYRVTGATWLARPLVDVPFYTMVNLVAGRRIVPELIQGEMTGERIAAEARRLLEDPAARERMRADLAETAQRLSLPGARPMERAASVVTSLMEGQVAHVS